MKPGRDPVLRGELQSDLQGNGFNILDVGAVGDIQAGTLYVEPTLAAEFGERGTGLPFQTIGAAVAAALAGDTIILRPGIHAYDGVLDIFHLTNLRIFGYGAIIKSKTEVNETIKMTIRSSGVMIRGVEFDGGLTGTPTLTGSGCIEVTETGFVCQDCFIHDQNGYGIHFPVHYDGAKILDNTIQNCLAGVFCEADPDGPDDTQGFWFKRNIVQHNRSFGVGLTGPGPDSGKFITGIQIKDNEFSGNDTDVGHVPVVSLTFACQGVQIQGNVIRDESSGIVIDKCKDVSISGNNLKGITETAIGWTGCIGVRVIDNLVDGRSAAGTATTSAPFAASGFYSVANDAGQFVIEGNELIFLKTNTNAIAISNATGVIINSNRIENAILLAAVSTVVVNGNTLSIPQTTQAILIDASNNGCSRITVSSNRFRFTGASINRCITTVDATATGIDDVLISGNSTPVGQAFSIASYGHSGSNLATNVVQIGNTPENVLSTAGWANVGVAGLLNKVFVSQARGRDQTGLRQSRNFKFATIGAAITAAVTGDMIIVEDGIFNERLDLKAGVFTLRFLESATLVASSASGCMRSVAASAFWKVYHEHAQISCATNNPVVAWTHATSLLTLYADLYNNGSGSSARAINCTDSTVELFGSAVSANAQGIGMSGSASPVVHVHGRNRQVYDILGGGTSVAVSVAQGEFVADECFIRGNGAAAVDLQLTDAIKVSFKRCSLQSGLTTAGAVSISTPGSTVPLFQDCVLQAGATATQTIIAGSAQTIKLYGQTVANKGSDPPTNVTFTGGGTYDVSSTVTAE